MLTLNLQALGVTEEALKNAILSELDLTPEQAVKALAEQLGVSLEQPTKTISNGDSVNTSAGEAKAAILTAAEAQTIKQAGDIVERLFG